MNKKKVYMFKYKGWQDKWHDSKTYVRAYQCQKASEKHRGRELKFFEAEVDWQEVESVYNKNTISGGK